MKLTNRFYNEERFRKDVEENLSIVNSEEASAWLRHPCTVALRAAVQGDMCGILNVWLDGGYSSEESIDATAQREAKARGIAQTLDDILETIDQIGYLEMKGDME